MTPPPATRFTVTATVTVANDEGETASGTIEFQTEYQRETQTLPQPIEPPAPTFTQNSSTMITFPGFLVNVRADHWFDNAGTNPRITDASFSTTDYFSKHTIARDMLWMEIKTAAQLNAMASPPPSPFTFDVTVTMTNDEGQTASGIITYQTEYQRETPTPSQPSEPEAAGPTFSMTEAVTARPGFQININAADAFDDAGTNPRLTDAVFSTTTYYAWHSLSRGLYVTVKSEAALNALAEPPPSPFTVDITLTMTNDEGQTASGTVTLQTTYDRMTAEERSRIPTPTFTQTEMMNAPPGESVFVYADDVFDDIGTNAKLTGAVFSTRKYHSRGHTGLGMLWLTTRSAEKLNAMETPPPSPFTVDVTVTMTNDEGKQASGTVTFRTEYDRIMTASERAALRPTFKLTKNYTLHASGGKQISARELFADAGTNPRITEAVFSPPMKYFQGGPSNVPRLVQGNIHFTLKTEAMLNAMTPPPPSPFTFTADVTMENDEGHEASGTVTFQVTYARRAPEPEPEEEAPSFSQTATWNAPPGIQVYATAQTAFNNAGTNPTLTNAVFSTTKYYSVHDIVNGILGVRPKTSAELNALAEPPPNPFTVDVTVTMTNDEGQTASGTITFRTEYERPPATTPVPPAGPPPSQGGQAAPPS